MLTSGAVSGNRRIFLTVPVVSLFATRAFDHASPLDFQLLLILIQFGSNLGMLFYAFPRLFFDLKGPLRSCPSQASP